MSGEAFGRITELMSEMIPKCQGNEPLLGLVFFKIEGEPRIATCPNGYELLGFCRALDALGIDFTLDMARAKDVTGPLMQPEGSA